MIKSQTATEYLVILGVVITLSVMVVSSLTDVINLGGAIDDKALLQEFAYNFPLAIESWDVGEYMTIITLTNKGNSLLNLNSFETNCLLLTNVNDRLGPADSLSFYFPGRYSFSEEFFEINYTDGTSGSSYTFVSQNQKSTCDGLMSSLIGYWSFTDSVKDSSQNKNDLTALINGGYPRSVQGRVGKGYENTNTLSTSQLLRLGTYTNYPEFGVSSFTLVSWVNMNSYSNRVILRIGSGTDLFLAVMDQRLQFYDGITFRSTGTYNTRPPLGEWSHIAIVVRNSTTVDYYYNGELDTTFTLGYGGLDSSVLTGSSRIEFMGTSGTLSQNLDGSMDEIYFFSEQLSANQIQAMYNADLAKK